MGDIGFERSANVTHSNTTMVRRVPSMGLFLGNSDNAQVGNSKGQTADGGAISGGVTNGDVSLRLVLTFLLMCVGGIAFGLGC